MGPTVEKPAQASFVISGLQGLFEEHPKSEEVPPPVHPELSKRALPEEVIPPDPSVALAVAGSTLPQKVVLASPPPTILHPTPQFTQAYRVEEAFAKDWKKSKS